MNGIIESYQQEKALEQPGPGAARLAVVDYVGSSGLQLIFEGEDTSDGKYYLCNNGIKYQVGDRVLVQKVGGSYIVVCRVGRPDALIVADRAELARRAIRMDNIAGTIGDLEFYLSNRGALWVHCVADDDNKWTKLSGEPTTSPGNINRPSWP